MPSDREDRQRNLLAECPMFMVESGVRLPRWLCLETLPEFSHENTESPVLAQPIDGIKQ